MGCSIVANLMLSALVKKLLNRSVFDEVMTKTCWLTFCTTLRNVHFINNPVKLMKQKCVCVLTRWISVGSWSAATVSQPATTKDSDKEQEAFS